MLDFLLFSLQGKPFMVKKRNMKEIFTGSVSEGSFSRNCTMQYASCEEVRIYENKIRTFLQRNHKTSTFLKRDT